MTDEEILEHIGLSPKDLTEFYRKFNNFLNGLNPEERRVMLGSLKSSQQAATDLGHDVKPEQLEKLLQSYAPERGAICICCRQSPRPPRPREE
jgi:hypothetical protein